MTGVIDTFENIINSRQLMERFEDLSGLRIDNIITRDEAAELSNLECLISSIEQRRDCLSDGFEIVRYSYFTLYVTDLVHEISGMAIENMPEYLRSNIDWEGVANDFKKSFPEVTFDGVSYYVDCS